jgi:hypothetical protein
VATVIGFPKIIATHTYTTVGENADLIWKRTVHVVPLLNPLGGRKNVS